MATSEEMRTWRERLEAARDLVILAAEQLVDQGSAPLMLETVVGVLRKVQAEDPEP